MIVPDVNMLIYAYSPQAPESQHALRWWEGLLSGRESVGMPWVVAMGFVRLFADPRNKIETVPPDVSIATIKEWFARPVLKPITPGPKHLDIYSDLLMAQRSPWKFATDAHIAALAIEHEAVVHTHDKGFERFKNLKCYDPLTS